MERSYIENLVKSYKDYPKKGILFRDLSPLFRNTESFKELIDKMSNLEICLSADAVIGIDARGFLLASPIALRIEKPLILARKPGKLPGDLITRSYSLEYGKNSLSVQKESLVNLKSFVIVDDLLATGGTVDCVARILYSQNKKITGLNTVIELEGLGGRRKFDFPVNAQISY